MKFSIIVPCYNAEKFLPLMLASVEGQSYPNYELIIVDDGSTDSSLKIAQHYAKSNSSIKVFAQKNSGKPSIARNVGIKIATGDILTFLDADDIYHPERLALLANGFNRCNDCSVIIHDYIRVDEEGAEFGEPLVKRHWKKYGLNKYFNYEEPLWLAHCDIYRAFIESCFFVHTSSIAIRLKDYDKENLYFNEALTYYEDITKWCEVVIKKQVVYVDQTLSYYRESPNSLMANTLNFELAGVDFYQQQLNEPLSLLSDNLVEILQCKKCKEIKDACYSASKVKKTAVVFHLASKLLVNDFTFYNLVFVAKCSIKSIY
jgi:glycosyltransferase involved in cell wall biosynthesis